MPITASPQPSSSPVNKAGEGCRQGHRSDGSAAGGRRAARAARSCPRKAVTTRRLAAISTRSWMRHSLETAATISGVSPGATAARAASSTASSSNQSRRSPTVSDAIEANAARSWPSMISRVTSSSLVGYHNLGQEVRQWQVGPAPSVPATRSPAVAAATPASWFARSQWRGARHEHAQVIERVAGLADRCGIHHLTPLSNAPPMSWFTPCIIVHVMYHRSRRSTCRFYKRLNREAGPAAASCRPRRLPGTVPR